MMRQRPTDVDSVRLFVETQPRPVNRINQVRNSDNSAHSRSKKPLSDENRRSFYKALSVYVISFCMIGFGLYIIRNNKYGFFHKQLVTDYQDYMQEWFTKHASNFENSKFTLVFLDSNLTIPLEQKYFKSKRGLNRSTLNRNGGASNDDLVEFVTNGTLLDLLFPNPQSSPINPTNIISSSSSSVSRANEDGSKVVLQNEQQKPLSSANPLQSSTSLAFSSSLVRNGKGGMRRVTPDMQKPFRIQIISEDGLTGRRSEIPIKHPVLIDTLGAAPGVTQHKCAKDFAGFWDGQTCQTHRYIWNMCVKVVRDASGLYRLDDTGGDVGCFANTWPSYSPYMWRPLYVNHGNGDSSADAAAAAAAAQVDDDDITSLLLPLQKSPIQKKKIPSFSPSISSTSSAQSLPSESLMTRLGLEKGLYIPFVAQYAMRFTVRHTRDPDVLERARMRYIGPNLDRQMLWNAVGWAVCFIGIVLFLAVSIWTCQTVTEMKERAAAQRLRNSVGKGGGGMPYNERYGITGGTVGVGAATGNRLTRRAGGGGGDDLVAGGGAYEAKYGVRAGENEVGGDKGDIEGERNGRGGRGMLGRNGFEGSQEGRSGKSRKVSILPGSGLV
uniref:Uncharacterized protein n=1 Tax=Polytomella parva TaxID=51329 RepID=A0A7S0YI41_9CHLO